MRNQGWAQYGSERAASATDDPVPQWLVEVALPSMATRTGTKLPRVRELSDEEARTEFDAQARRHLHMSGEEFLRRWDAREFPDTEDPDVGWVASLIHLVR